MNRPMSQAGASPASTLPIQIILERALLGAFVALVVARPLVSGDDPGRLRLTTGGGSVSFNLCVLLLFVATAIWRLRYATTGTRERPFLPLALATLGLFAFVSSQLGDRYARPGVFIAWEWICLGVAVHLARRLAGSSSDARSVVHVIVATSVSIASLAIYQSLTEPLGLQSLDVSKPNISPQLVGDDEFYPELNRSNLVAKSPRGTFDSPATLLLFLLLLLPIAFVSAKAGFATKRGRWLMAIPIIIGLGIIAALFARPFAENRDAWGMAADMLRSRMWLGVGPGNFSRMAADPSIVPSAWVELAATIGLIGLVLFLVAIGFAFWRAISPTREPTTNPNEIRRWEFHVGGAAGLVLGFVWAYGDVPAESPPNEVFKLGAAAVFRAIVWFVAFAFLESVRPSTRAIVRAIVVGAAVVVLLGPISEASSRPTLLFPAFVLLTMAANLRGSPAEVQDGKWARAVRTAVAMAAIMLTVAYLVMACLPAWATASAVRKARISSRHFPERDREVDRARPGATRATALTHSRGFLLANIIGPLHDATERDPSNAALWLELARWRRPLWRYQLTADPENAARVADDTRKAAEIAGQLDPHNLAAKKNLFEAMLLYRRESKALEPERVAALNKLIGQIAEKEPTSEVPMRHRLVLMLFDRSDLAAVKNELYKLRELNGVAGSPHGSISQEQDVDLTKRLISLELEMSLKAKDKRR